jgi:hypothetical protein
MVSDSLTQHTPKALKVVFTICFAAGLAFTTLPPSFRFLLRGFSSIVRQGSSELSGVVLASGTKSPLADALVAVESADPQADQAFGSYSRTDSGGRFTASIEGDLVSVKVWKQGYAPGGSVIDGGSASKGVAIELREMTQTNWVSNHEDFYELKPGTGFSFALGKVVGDNSPEADIIISQTLEDRTVALIEARGDGGIVFQPYEGGVDFYNSPEAPLTGYKTSERFDPSRNPSEDGLYFVRTRDGKHYAKFRISISFGKSAKGKERLDFDLPSRLIWSYQSDGTRNLEVAPDKKMAFPFYKFTAEIDSSS